MPGGRHRVVVHRELPLQVGAPGSRPGHGVVDRGPEERADGGPCVDAAAAVEAAAGIGLVEVHHHPRRDHALVLVERLGEARPRLRVVVEHQVPADEAARVREAVRMPARLREEEEPGRLRAVGGEHDRPGGLGLLDALGVQVHHARHASLRARLDARHDAAVADLAAAGPLGHGDHRRQRRRLRADLARLTPAEAAVDARGPLVVGSRQDRQRGRLRGVAGPCGAVAQEHAGGLDRHGGHGIAARSRRVAGARLAGYAHLPVDLGVVGLELVVGDGPVGEGRPGNRAEQAALTEVDGPEAPVVRREVQAAAADGLGVEEGGEEEGRRRLLIGRRAPGVGMVGEAPDQAAVEVRLDLVVAELEGTQVRALLHHDDGEAVGGEFLGQHSAGRSRADDHEIDLLGRREADHLLPHRSSSSAAGPPCSFRS